MRSSPNGLKSLPRMPLNDEEQSRKEISPPVIIGDNQTLEMNQNMLSPDYLSKIHN
jgi:hypothetical protein